MLALPADLVVVPSTSLRVKAIVILKYNVVLCMIYSFEFESLILARVREAN